MQNDFIIRLNHNGKLLKPLFSGRKTDTCRPTKNDFKNISFVSEKISVLWKQGDNLLMADDVLIRLGLRISTGDRHSLFINRPDVTYSGKYINLFNIFWSRKARIQFCSLRNISPRYSQIGQHFSNNCSKRAIGSLVFYFLKKKSGSRTKNRYRGRK